MKNHLRSFTISLLLFALLLSSAFAQSLPVVAPTDLGFSAGRLDRINQMYQLLVEQKRLAGAVTLVARKGSIAQLRAYGMADLEANRLMRPDTIFRIASMSKPITSVAVMMLLEEGKLLLTDPLSKYLPEFTNMQVLVLNEAGSAEPYKLVPAKRPITIHHLLTHTSGISYKFVGRKHLAALYQQAGIADGLSQAEGTLQQNVWKIAKQPLRSQPGEEWEYGLSTDVLGRVVEVISGQSFADYLEQRIFRPLGMLDTYFFLPQEKVTRLAALYRPLSNRAGIEKYNEAPVEIGTLTYSSSYHYQGPRSYYSGGAGLVSTATDYWKFLQMLLNGGEFNNARLLSRKSVELMTTGIVNMGSDPDPAMRFGLGVSVRMDLGKSRTLGSIGEYNWGGFFHTTFFADPKEELIGIALTQLYPTDLDDGQRFKTLVYQAIVD